MRVIDVNTVATAKAFSNGPGMNATALCMDKFMRFCNFAKTAIPRFCVYSVRKMVRFGSPTVDDQMLLVKYVWRVP